MNEAVYRLELRKTFWKAITHKVAMFCAKSGSDTTAMTFNNLLVKVLVASVVKNEKFSSRISYLPGCLLHLCTCCTHYCTGIKSGNPTGIRIKQNQHLGSYISK